MQWHSPPISQLTDCLHTVVMFPLLLLPHSQGEQCTQKVEELGQHMRAEMEILINQMEAKMTKMREQMEARCQKNEEKMEAHTEKIEEKTKAQYEKLMCEMTEKLEEQETQLAAVETRLLSVRDLPYLMVCVYQDIWTTAGATITYDAILSDYNNSDKPGGGDGKLDIETGTYTAITPGHYTVTFSGVAGVNAGEEILIYLWCNGERVVESKWHSYVSAGDVSMYDQGSRIVVSGGVLYYMYCIVCTVLYVLYYMYCIVCTVLYVLYCICCIVCTVLYVLYCMCCIVYTVLYRVSKKKIGISDLMCVGCLLAMLTGHMIPFWNPWDQTSVLGVIISLMIILRMIRKV